MQRALISCSLECPENYLEVLNKLYHAFWYQKKGAQLPEVHRSIIANVVGEEKADKILERVRLPRILLQVADYRW